MVYEYRGIEYSQDKKDLMYHEMIEEAHRKYLSGDYHNTVSDFRILLDEFQKINDLIKRMENEV